MSHSSKIFESQPITVQNLNGFDLSHIFAGTSKCGQLVPVLKKLLMQGSKISVGAAVNVELPPLATSFFGRIDFCIELFYCPCAVLYGGWRQFISNQVASMFPSSQDSILENGGYALPVLDLGFAENVVSAQIHPRTSAGASAFALDATNDGLSDYLGVRINGIEPEAGNDSALPLYINLLPYLAYHKIVDVFYRNYSTTRTWFAVNPNFSFSGSSSLPGDIQFSGIGEGQVARSVPFKNVSLVWHSFYTLNNILGDNNAYSSNRVFSSLSEITFPDDINVLQTRQRTYARDYFTAGSVNPQQGNPGTLSLDINPGGEDITATLSVHGLRALVAIQRFEEKLNYSPDYRNIMRNLFGSVPKDALLDEPSYIGRLVLPVYQKSVYQQDAVQQDGGTNSTNPFVSDGALGAKGAHGSFTGEGQFCKNYKIGSFGYLIALASLVPHAMYGYGIDREMLATEIGDFPFPDLQTVGMDGTKLCEVYADIDISKYNDTFNFLPRYSWMKYKLDQVAGELRPGKSLDSFVLQRVFTDEPEFGTDFVTIAQTDLDGVFAVSVDNMNLSCWFEIYWVFKAVMPLAAFCIPTLGELHDVHTITTPQGGSRL